MKICANAGMKNSSSFRKSFFAAPTPKRNGMTNRNFTLISLIIKRSAKKLVNNLFCMNFSKIKQNIILQILQFYNCNFCHKTIINIIF